MTRLGYGGLRRNGLSFQTYREILSELTMMQSHELAFGKFTKKLKDFIIETIKRLS